MLKLVHSQKEIKVLKNKVKSKEEVHKEVISNINSKLAAGQLLTLSDRLYIENEISLLEDYDDEDPRIGSLERLLDRAEKNYKRRHLQLIK